MFTTTTPSGGLLTPSGGVTTPFGGVTTPSGLLYEHYKNYSRIGVRLQAAHP